MAQKRRLRRDGSDALLDCDRSMSQRDQRRPNCFAPATLRDNAAFEIPDQLVARSMFSPGICILKAQKRGGARG
jgi:hypothetical protein